MSLTVPAGPVYFRSAVSWTALEAVRRVYDPYCSARENLDDAELVQVSDGVDLDAFLEEDLAWGQPGDADDMTEEALDATRLLVKAASQDVSI